jgi:hypothetical protein
LLARLGKVAAGGVGVVVVWLIWGF